MRLREEDLNTLVERAGAQIGNSALGFGVIARIDGCDGTLHLAGLDSADDRLEAAAECAWRARRRTCAAARRS